MKNLHHGTCKKHAVSIERFGTVIQDKTALDFGRGFYTTDILEKAIEWGNIKFELNRQMGRDSIGPPAVVHYSINHEVLGELKYRHLKEHEAIEYAVYCRIGRPHELDEKHYDIIQGYVIDRGISEGTSRLRRLIATGKLSENDINKEIQNLINNVEAYPYEQIVFKTERSIMALRYDGYTKYKTPKFKL